MSDPAANDLLAVPDAAARLSISERHLRRLLARPEYTGRTRTGTRTTRTGTRTYAGVPPDLLCDLQEALEHKGEPEATEENSGAEQRQDAGENTDNTGTAPLFAADLIEQLKADLAHERAERRGEVDRLNKALERAQTLHLGTMGELQEMRRRALELETQNAKLIAALPPVGNAPESPLEGDSTGDRAEGGHSQPNTSAEGKKRGFFARLFGGKRNEAK